MFNKTWYSKSFLIYKINKHVKKDKVKTVKKKNQVCEINWKNANEYILHCKTIN